MKSSKSVLLCFILSCTGVANAGQVVEPVPDTLPGKGFGGLTGFMVGAAVGGPIGAVALGLGSAWAGGKVQEATGLHGTAYLVEQADGKQVVVRAPGQEFSAGDPVHVEGARMARQE